VSVRTLGKLRPTGLSPISSVSHLVTNLSQHCTKLWVEAQNSVAIQILRVGKLRVSGSGFRFEPERIRCSLPILTYQQTFTPPHPRPRRAEGAARRTAYIKGHYRRAKFGRPKTTKGRQQGLNVSLTPPPSKFHRQIFAFFIFRSQFGQQIEKNIGKPWVAFLRKFHLKIAKFPMLPII